MTFVSQKRRRHAEALVRSNEESVSSPAIFFVKKHN
jgi:hypothetical protein